MQKTGFTFLLAVLFIGVSLPAMSQSLSDISSRWSCEFKNNPRSNKLTQGIECDTLYLCNSPAQKSPLTYTDLDHFTIDLIIKQSLTSPQHSGFLRFDSMSANS